MHVRAMHLHRSWLPAGGCVRMHVCIYKPRARCRAVRFATNTVLFRSVNFRATTLTIFQHYIRANLTNTSIQVLVLRV